MNTKITIVVLSFALLSITGKAQFSTDIYGVIPIKKCGWGMGIGLFSPGLSIGDIQLRVGADLFGSGLVKRNVYNVPLDAQTGDATVHLKNNLFGFNGVLRISLPYDNTFVPYIDIFAGQRFFNANMNITPNQPTLGYQSSTYKDLGSVNQLNYGAAIGVLASLSESFKFNAGIMYTYSPKNNELFDVDKAHLESGTIIIDPKAIPHGMFIAKVGFTFMLNGSGVSSGRCRTRSSGGGIFRSSGGIRTGGTRSGGGGGLLNGVKIGGSRPRT